MLKFIIKNLKKIILILKGIFLKYFLSNNLKNKVLEYENILFFKLTCLYDRRIVKLIKNKRKKYYRIKYIYKFLIKFLGVLIKFISILIVYLITINIVLFYIFISLFFLFLEYIFVILFLGFLYPICILFLYPKYSIDKLLNNIINFFNFLYLFIFIYTSLFIIFIWLIYIYVYLFIWLFMYKFFLPIFILSIIPVYIIYCIFLIFSPLNKYNIKYITNIINNFELNNYLKMLKNENKVKKVWRFHSIIIYIYFKFIIIFLFLYFVLYLYYYVYNRISLYYNKSPRRSYISLIFKLLDILGLKIFMEKIFNLNLNKLNIFLPFILFNKILKFYNNYLFNSIIIYLLGDSNFDVSKIMKWDVQKFIIIRFMLILKFLIDKFDDFANWFLWKIYRFVTDRLPDDFLLDAYLIDKYLFYRDKVIDYYESWEPHLNIHGYDYYFDYVIDDIMILHYRYVKYTIRTFIRRVKKWVNYIVDFIPKKIISVKNSIYYAIIRGYFTFISNLKKFILYLYINIQNFFKKVYLYLIYIYNMYIYTNLYYIEFSLHVSVLYNKNIKYINNYYHYFDKLKLNFIINIRKFILKFNFILDKTILKCKIILDKIILKCKIILDKIISFKRRVRRWKKKRKRWSWKRWI